MAFFYDILNRLGKLVTWKFKGGGCRGSLNKGSLSLIKESGKRQLYKGRTHLGSDCSTPAKHHRETNKQAGHSSPPGERIQNGELRHTLLMGLQWGISTPLPSGIREG